MTGLSGKISAASAVLGIDARKLVRTLKAMPAYFSDLKTLKRQSATAHTQFPFGKLFPCLEDRSAQLGVATGHYFHQDLLVARRICENAPDLHMDVGSRIDGFVAHVASFRSIVVLDIRPLRSNIPNVKFIQTDLMSDPPDGLIDSCDSLSCLHALEHFGLGRYGDSVSYDGYLKGLTNLCLLLKKGGKLYLSVPIGPQRIEFNAHRVFSVDYLLQCLSGQYNIDHFSFVDDKGDLHENVLLSPPGIQSNFGCYYGCGIVEMTKI